MSRNMENLKRLILMDHWLFKMREPQAMTKTQSVRDAYNLMNIMNTIKRMLFDMLLTNRRNRQFAHSQQYSLLYDGVVVVL
ncbi:hypothetical protein C8R34_13723 [Nitrosomonas sp. Nm84]|nr:hypothetical protein C8R34_13723 [Nitrosomonas sp. Nm84]